VENDALFACSEKIMLYIIPELVYLLKRENKVVPMFNLSITPFAKGRIEVKFYHSQYRH
jgi:hypothetical protein